MKANELMLGNWIRAGANESTVDQIRVIGSMYHINLNGNGIANRLDQLKPIPLTEEWLIKFGINLKYKGCYEPFTDVFWYVEPNGSLIDSSEGIGWAINLPQYVHELQNLYFALTGEELTIKE